MNKDSRILITGATGLVGSYVARLLHQQGYRHLVATRREGSRTELLDGLEGKIEWLTGDLSDPYFSNRIVFGSDIIIHCAGFISFSSSDEDRMIAVNKEATANLVNASLASGTRHFIHVSSIAALGRTESEQTIDEHAIWERNELNSNYAISKFLGEMEVWRGYAEGLPAVIINPSTILGGGFWGTGSLEILEKVWNGLIFYTEGATGFVDVRDVAKAVLILLQQEITGRRYIVSGGNMTFRDMFGRIARGMDKKAPYLKVRPWMAELVWRGSSLVSRITGKKPFVEREVARMTQRRYTYDNERSVRDLGLEYLPLEQTISETTAAYVESMKEKRTYAVLPLAPV